MHIFFVFGHILFFLYIDDLICFDSLTLDFDIVIYEIIMVVFPCSYCLFFITICLKISML